MSVVFFNIPAAILAYATRDTREALRGTFKVPAMMLAVTR